MGASAEDKHAFLSSMGHELRNPLSGIIAHAETLMEGVFGPLEEAQKSALQAIQGDVRHLLHLVSDMMDLGKLEAGPEPLNPVLCRVADKTARCIDSVSDFARPRSIRLQADVYPAHLTVMADTRRLRQIITELLSAATLTTSAGGLVRLSLTTDNEGLCLQAIGEAPHFTTGPSPQTSPNPALLERLRKLKPIGMALLQKLVQIHNGAFTAGETDSHAAVLSVYLPMVVLPSTESSDPPATVIVEPVIESSAPSAESESSFLRRTILLADDQPTLITVTRNYLESIGFEVLIARDGREAVQLTTTLRPDLIMMDVRMPVMDGLHAIREIRESSDPEVREIPIISLSGLPGAADKGKCLAAGASAYLNKPFGIKELDQAIAEFVRPPR